MYCSTSCHRDQPFGCQNTVPGECSSMWNRSSSRPSLRWSRFSASSSMCRYCCRSSLDAQAVPYTRCSSTRSEEHTSELQSRPHIVCRLLLEKKHYYRICQQTLEYDWS